MRGYRVEIPESEYWQRQINCQDACPVNTDARGYVRAIAEGRYEDAYLIARGPNPLASICGRVCGAPCEAACRRGEIDQSVSIRALKRFAMSEHLESSRDESTRAMIDRLIAHSEGRDCLRSEELGALAPLFSRETPPESVDGPKVAIVGSGPAGLAAAHDLALLGYRPTVYEMDPIPAGMLVVGIPEYRLPRDLVAAEVEFIRSLGVEFVCNTAVGRDITLAELRECHEAVVIAVGLKTSAKLPLPGGDGPGVLGGVELLRDISLNEPTDLAGDVIVIGGGNVAYDVARTVVRQTGVDVSRSALRQAGVGCVHLCSLESLDDLPADDIEILEGDEEGVLRHHGIGPKEILRDDDGNVRGMSFQRAIRVFDEDGRFSPLFDEADLTTIEAKTVVWAIGQRSDLSLLSDAADIQLNERGQIQCDADTLRTSASDVYVAGDIAYGPRLLIDAVASGKKVAREIHKALGGQAPVEQSQLVHIDLPDYAREADYEKIDRVEVPTADPESRRGDQAAQVELGYDSTSASCEGSRCLDCGVNTIFDSAKCILCGGCADVCPELCLQLVSLDQLTGEPLLDQTIDRQVDRADPAGNSAIIKDETRCIRCAQCAARCPVGAITMERVAFTSCWSIGNDSETHPEGETR